MILDTIHPSFWLRAASVLICEVWHVGFFSFVIRKNWSINASEVFMRRVGNPYFSLTLTFDSLSAWERASPFGTASLKVSLFPEDWTILVAAWLPKKRKVTKTWTFINHASKYYLFRLFLKQLTFRFNYFLNEVPQLMRPVITAPFQRLTLVRSLCVNHSRGFHE